MKNLLTCFIAFLCITSVYAQCENAYFPFREGVSFELTTYTAKGKEDGKIKSVVQSAEGNTIVVRNEIYDKKGKPLNEGTYEVICEDGTVKIDMRRFIPAELLESYQNMDVTMEGDFLEFPKDLQVGQTLPDGSGKVTVKLAEGAMNMNTTMDMTFTARNVEKKETLTTPAGTFETYKITQTTISKTTIMGMSREMTITSASWIAEGVGTVRSETYDKKGELNSYMLLTNLSK